MITLVTGVPGSGKTYYAVHHIWKLSPPEREKVLHNIDGLKVGTTFDSLLSSENLQIQTLCSDSYHAHEKRFHGYKFVIDECQTFLGGSLRSQDILRFFQLHRHYGIDVILITQDYKLVSQKISSLAEFQLRAVSDIANPLPGTFLYKKMVGYESIGKEVLRKRKEVFALYKTATELSAQSKKRPMLYLAAAGVILVVLAGFLLHRLTGLSSRSKNVFQKSSFSTDSGNSSGLLERAVRRKVSSRSSRFGSGDSLPASLTSKLGGCPYTLNSISSSSGVTVFFLGQMIPVKDFPYPVFKAGKSYIALLPDDMFSYLKNFAPVDPSPRDERDVVRSGGRSRKNES